MADRAYIHDGTGWVDLPTGGRNILLNGAMNVAQRGSSHTRGSSDGYTLDRWYASGYGSGQPFSVLQADDYQLPTQYAQYVRQSTSNSTNFFISQSLEVNDVALLKGKYVTLSFSYKNYLNHTNQWNASVYSAAGSNVNLAHSGVSRTELGTKLLPNSSTWVSDSITVLVPSSANSLCVEFKTLNSTVASAEFRFTNVQLEIGKLATAFSTRPYQEELNLCQRYYQYVYGLSHGAFDTSYNVEGMVISYNQMRTTPTVLYYDWIKHGHVGGNTNYLPANYTLEVSTSGMSLWWNTSSAAYRATGYRGYISAYLQAEL